MTKWKWNIPILSRTNHLGLDMVVRACNPYT
jgi:hypothetical protein